MEYKLVKRKGRPTWEIEYTENVFKGNQWRKNRRRISTGTGNEEEAKAFFDAYVNTPDGEIDQSIKTVEDVLHEYTNELIARKTSYKNMIRHNSIVKVLCEYLGGINYSELKRKHTTDYLRNRTVQPQTASRELQVLRAALGYCKNEELIEWNPFKMDLVKPKARERFLSEDEITKLINACEGHVKLWTLIALSTAARAGAILSLTVDRVNFEEETIDFREELDCKHKPRSYLRMPNELRPHLQQAVKNSQSGYVVERKGKPLRAIYPDFMKAVKKAGLQEVTPHILRHTCAVHMVKNGVPIYEVAQYLGHTSTAITEKHYAKFHPDFMGRSSEVASGLIKQELRVVQS